MEIRKNVKYQLRYAAGIYWLLDMNQPGIPYQKPLPLNETGAFIWQMLEKGNTQEEIADCLSKKYGMNRKMSLEDVRTFVGQLCARGMNI